MKYERPKMELLELESADVITSSFGLEGGDIPLPGEGGIDGGDDGFN